MILRIAFSVGVVWTVGNRLMIHCIQSYFYELGMSIPVVSRAVPFW